MQIHTPTAAQGRRGGWNPSPEFLICCSILKRLSLQWKVFDLLNKMLYLAYLILVRIRKQLKTARNGNFLCLK